MDKNDTYALVLLPQSMLDFHNLISNIINCRKTRVIAHMQGV